MTIYIIYFIIIALLAVEYEFKQFNSLPAIIVVVILLGLLAGLRAPEVAKDYDGYKYSFDAIYNYYADLKNGQLFTFFEPGFILLVVAIRSFAELDYTIYSMLFFALTGLAIKAGSIQKMSNNAFVVLLLYFSHYFALFEMTQIRIGFASAIFFVACYQYLNGKWIQFSLLIVLATAFHYSAILYFLVLFFNYKNFNRYIYGSVLVACILLAIIKIPLFETIGGFNPELLVGKLKGHATQNVENAKINVFNSIYIINIMAIAYLVFIVPFKLLKENKWLIFFTKCNILSVFLLSFLAGAPTIAFRISEMFGVTSVFMFAGMVYYLPFKKLNIVVAILLAGVFFYINYFHNDLIKPYNIANFRSF